MYVFSHLFSGEVSDQKQDFSLICTQCLNCYVAQLRYFLGKAIQLGYLTLLSHTSWAFYFLASSFGVAQAKTKLILESLFIKSEIWKFSPNHLTKWVALFLASLTKDSSSSSHQPGGGSQPDSLNDDWKEWNNRSSDNAFSCLWKLLPSPRWFLHPFLTMIPFHIKVPLLSLHEEGHNPGFYRKAISFPKERGKPRVWFL